MESVQVNLINLNLTGFSDLFIMFAGKFFSLNNFGLCKTFFIHLKLVSALMRLIHTAQLEFTPALLCR